MLNAQGSRVIIIVVQVGPVKLYCSSSAVQALRKKERKRKMKLSLPPNLLAKKTSLGPNYFLFVKNFIPSYAFDALLCHNWPFSPPPQRLKHHQPWTMCKAIRRLAKYGKMCHIVTTLQGWGLQTSVVG
jgi:hypothetical protein